LFNRAYLILSFIFYFLFIVGCKNSSNNEVTTIFNPKEVYPFIHDQTVIKIANDPIYVFHQIPDAEYGITFNAKLSDIGVNSFCKLQIKTNINLKQLPQETAWVLELWNNDNKQLLYQSVLVNEKVKSLNSWEPLTLEANLNIPALFNPENRIKVYFWNKSKIEFNFDKLIFTVK
jgi:hypothetical protein